MVSFYVEFVFYDFFDKISAFWKAVICEKGKHSELRRPSPLLALFPSCHAAVMRYGMCNFIGSVLYSAVLAVSG